jgi:hypothetical protein
MKYFSMISHRIIASALLGALCVSFVPTPVKADPLGFSQQLTLNGIQVNTAVSATANAAAATGITSLTVKETLDGIAWKIAKQMVSNMTRSLINWVNSGFAGSPAFVTDLNQMLLDSVDQVAGEYIKSLGGIGEFICSPFRLDVQAALAINYAETRSGMPSGPTESMCTLTGIGSNIENFLGGSVDSWEEWLTVTANPQNTPYGAYLEAEAKLNIRLSNAAGQELEYAAWGNGFLSKKVCEPVEGGGEKCTIVTPGEIISDSLKVQLATGQETLIEADEINELIGALMQQLALKAVEGINGLLGLSEKDADSGKSYLDELVDEQTELVGNLAEYKAEMDSAYATEAKFRGIINAAIATTTYQLGQVGSSTSSSSLTTTGILVRMLSEAQDEQLRVASNMLSLQAIIDAYENASSSASSSKNIQELRLDAIYDYITLKSKGYITTEAYITQKQNEWDAIWRELFSTNQL